MLLKGFDSNAKFMSAESIIVLQLFFRLEDKKFFLYIPAEFAFVFNGLWY